MFEDIRNKMRDKIRSFDYVMTLHAEEEMENDNLSIFDIENAILTGKIVERQKMVKRTNGNISLHANRLMTKP